MEENNPYFGHMRKRENFLQDYVGMYVVLYTLNRSRGGLLEGFDENNEFVILSDFQATIYREGKLSYVMRKDKKGCRIRLSDIIEVEPVSEASLREYCKYQNQLVEESEKKRAQEEKDGRPEN